MKELNEKLNNRSSKELTGQATKTLEELRSDRAPTSESHLFVVGQNLVFVRIRVYAIRSGDVSHTIPLFQKRTIILLGEILTNTDLPPRFFVRVECWRKMPFLFMHPIGVSAISRARSHYPILQRPVLGTADGLFCIQSCPRLGWVRRLFSADSSHRALREHKSAIDR